MKIFGIDESDAFRHFVWAGLLANEFGRERAKEFLDAHETDPDRAQARIADSKGAKMKKYVFIMTALITVISFLGLAGVAN
ncbi:MAG: hypothetical protein ABL958_13190 [Bdellovibrionia bacterium]